MYRKMNINNEIDLVKYSVYTLSIYAYIRLIVIGFRDALSLHMSESITLHTMQTVEQ